MEKFVFKYGGKRMAYYRKHWHWKRKGIEYWMWMYWVAHDGFGRPRLSINTRRQGLDFVVLFTWSRFQWYIIKSYENRN